MTARARRWLDLALALAAAVALIVDGKWHAHGTLPWFAYPLALLTAAPLASRRQAPLASLLTTEAGAILCVIAFDPSQAAVVTVMVTLYTVALLGDRRRSLIVAAITVVLLVSTIFFVHHREIEFTEVALQLLLLLAALVVGDTVRARRMLRLAAVEQAERAEHEREERTRRRLTSERMQIARDLHDTVAHALVAINVRAGVAVRLHDRLDPTAALLDIKQASAEALQDLRITLHLLREQEEVAPVVPASDLDALPGLLERVRTGGLDARIEVRTHGVMIPSAVGQAAFRIVQEALTNVLRHAHATSARVEIDARSGVLHLAILDDGKGGDGASGGHGLRGMAERAAVLGGQVDAGPRAVGGWQVRAKLPLALSLDG